MDEIMKELEVSVLELISLVFGAIITFLLVLKFNAAVNFEFSLTCVLLIFQTMELASEENSEENEVTSS